jgi:hypothetical protein
MLMDRILENLLLANINGSYMINKTKKLAYIEIFFILRSLKTMRNNHSSPHNGPIKKIFPKILLSMHD